MSNMSDEELNQDAQVEPENVEEVEEPSDPLEAREVRLEERARQQGWKPFEEWDGDPDEWVGPETFIVRGEFFDKQRNLQKQLKEQQEVIKQQAELNRRLAQKEAEEEVQELRRQKAIAYENEDWDKTVELDEKIAEARKKGEEATKQPVEPDTQGNPEFERWVEQPENAWYKNNPVLRTTADALAVQYVTDHPNATFQETADAVTKQMEKEFPEKLGKKKPSASAVNEPTMSARGGSKRKASVNKLSEDQKKIGQKFVRQGAVKNLQEYADQLAAIGEL